MNLIVIGLIVSAVGSLATLLMAIVVVATYLRTINQDVTLSHLTDLTNGQAHALNALTADKARLEGEAAGQATERARSEREDL